MPIRKSIAAGVVVASLTVGGVAGATVFAPALSGAQEDDTTTSSDTTEPATETTETTATTDETTAADATADRATDEADDPAGERSPKGRFGPRLDGLAELLGITRDELTEALRDGQSIADIAEANGVDPQTVVDELTAQARARIEEQLAELPDRIEDFVNGEFDRPGPRFGGHGPFGDHHRPDAGADDEAGD